MTQPNDYGFGEEASLLKESARRFFTEKLPVDQLHALVASEPDPERGAVCAWRPELWQEMVELGWTALAVPESAGGLALPWVAVAGLVEESGRAAFPAPLLTTLSCSAVLGACGESATAALEEITAGAAATLAVIDTAGAGDAHVRAEDGQLSGEAGFVQDAGKCTRLLVLAREGTGSGLYWVAADAAGVSLAGDAIVDLTRDQSRVSFDSATAQRVGDGDALEAALPILWVLYAADMAGAAEWQLQTTVDYAQQRKQFDRPLGFFQAIKHQLVNAMVAIDESRSLLYSAACSLDAEAPDKARRLAHMAKASANDTAAFVSGRSIQCHGGIGFTWEAYLHLYFKRQKHSELLWGDANWHRAQLAPLVIDAA